MRHLAVGLLAVLPALAAAQTTDIEGTLLGDTYSYWIVSDGGTRDRAAVFAFEQADPPAPQYFFNYHDGEFIAQWQLDIPPALQGETLNVVSARVEIWNIMDAEWAPAAGEVRLFAAGFTGTNGFDETTWTENTAYAGPNAVADANRDPFPRDLGTGLTAEDDENATAWALGDPGAFYSGVPANDPDDAFKITFELNASDSTIQAELQADLASGLSTWIIGSTYAAAQPPATSAYPELITKEGVSNSAYGTSQAAPRLILEVEPVTVVPNWYTY